jgi:hypothetical protein
MRRTVKIIIFCGSALRKETPAEIYQTTWCHIPKYSNIHVPHRENLQLVIYILIFNNKITLQKKKKRPNHVYLHSSLMHHDWNPKVCLTEIQRPIQASQPRSIIQFSCLPLYPVTWTTTTTYSAWSNILHIVQCITKYFGLLYCILRFVINHAAHVTFLPYMNSALITDADEI